MSNPAAAETPTCSCSNIAIMQLFHELKQRFPAVPDRVVSECIRKNCHDRHSCELILSRENQTYLLHSYPASLKMCAAASEPSSPLASSFHGINLCDKFSVRQGPGPDNVCASIPTSPQFERTRSLHQPHVNSAWFDDYALSALHVNEARNTRLRDELPQASLCRDKLPCVDHLRRYLPDPFDQNWPVNDILLCHSAMQDEGGGTQRSNVASSTAQNCIRWNDTCMHPPGAHYLSQHGDTRFPHVPVSSCNSADAFSTDYRRQVQRPSSLNMRSHNVFSADEPLLTPTTPGCSESPGGDFGRLEFQPSQCRGQAGATQSSCKEGEAIDDFQVNVNCRLQQSPLGSSVNITSSTEPKPRMRSAIELQPMPHYSSLVRCQEGSSPRSFTSVNLMLRPPSSEPQPPIDIQSAGSSLTYSTSSYDPRQGYQSQLQIRIGPGASGSVTAVRTRAPASFFPQTAYSLARSGSLPDVNTVLSMISESSEESSSSLEEMSTAAQVAALDGYTLDPPTRELLLQQVECKARLQRELRREKDKLRKMQREVQNMRKDLEEREKLKRRITSLALPTVTNVLQRVQQLRQDIQWLQEECKFMTHQVDDLNTDTTVPLGETNEEFYKNIYTGQQGCILPPRAAVSSRPRRRSLRERACHWKCSACTYENHPLLDKCEQCDMPRIELGTRVATTTL